MPVGQAPVGVGCIEVGTALPFVSTQGGFTSPVIMSGMAWARMSCLSDMDRELSTIRTRSILSMPPPTASRSTVLPPGQVLPLLVEVTPDGVDPPAPGPVLEPPVPPPLLPEHPAASASAGMRGIKANVLMQDLPQATCLPGAG